MIRMFDPIFVNNLQPTPCDNLWAIELTIHNYKTRLLHET
jgi:hypothetical protein